MIIVRLKGGLGNQLFQYAAGRRLAQHHKTILKIDISIFESYKVHEYSLGVFNIQENIASADEIGSLTARDKGIKNLILRIFGKPRARINENHFHFDRRILSLPDNVYLDGYWQSEKYFSGIFDIIKSEFTVKAPQVGRNKEISGMIYSAESVSLHIRRGTYLKPPYNYTHGICPPEYYYSGIKYLESKIKHPHFFVFSDDPQWARDNLKLSYPVSYVDNNSAGKGYEDLRLMSQCKYHIIANSTFSWWGAWLSNYPGKIIIAPKRWFNVSRHNAADVYPARWVKL